ncbi:SWIM zinc finger family protein [Burkholderia ambifaria]|uniref:SWIM zinc finger family protein n=1 Tax=Burkholderia ambifaria TaxID=152480 RepID=UPI00158D133A|nr:SWIM zinc finger family protein [Burkholderia ambifaria]
METIGFLVQGSAATPYELSFSKDGNTVTAFCTCPAGETGTACKHRLSILAGVKSGVISDNVDQVQVVASWLPGSNLETRMAEPDNAEKAVEAAKKAVSAAKKRLAATMLGRN